MDDEVSDEIVIQIRTHQVRACYGEKHAPQRIPATHIGDLLRPPVPTTAELPCIFDEVQ